MHTCGRTSKLYIIMSIPTFIDMFNHDHLYSQPCGIEWGDRRSWGALSKTWKRSGSPRTALWEQCDSDFVCSTSTAAAMLLAPVTQKTASVDFVPSQPLPAEPQIPSLRGPPLLQLPADDLID